jgi:hypothetical protein
MVMFAVGVLGLAFWGLHVVHQGGSDVGGRYLASGWGVSILGIGGMGLTRAFPHGHPHSGLLRLSPFFSCAFGSAYAVSVAFVALVGLVELGDVAVGSWLLVFETRGFGMRGGGGFERRVMVSNVGWWFRMSGGGFERRVVVSSKRSWWYRTPGVSKGGGVVFNRRWWLSSAVCCC